MPLTLKQANTICEKALEHARAKNYAKLTIVVLDEAGNLKAAQREDGASMFRYDVALGKAWGAVAMICGLTGAICTLPQNPDSSPSGAIQEGSRSSVLIWVRSQRLNRSDG